MDHDRYVATETRISIVLNAVVSALFVWLMFRNLDRIGLWGQQGLAFDLLPTVFMITLMMTIALTLITRARMRKGVVTPSGPYRFPVPGNVILRAITLAVVFTVLIVPASIAVLALVWPATGDWSFTGVMIFKILFGIVLAVIITPVVLRAALADRSAVTART